MGVMEQQESLQTISAQAIEPSDAALPEELLIAESKAIWAGWRYAFIALGILIELMSAGLLVFLIVIIPEIDLIAILLFCIPFVTFAGGILVIRGSRWLK